MLSWINFDVEENINNVYNLLINEKVKFEVLILNNVQQNLSKSGGGGLLREPENDSDIPIECRRCLQIFRG